MSFEQLSILGKVTNMLIQMSDKISLLNKIKMQLYAIFIYFTFTSVLAVNRNIPSVEPEFLDMLKTTGQWRQFGRLLGIEDVRLLQPSKDRSKDPMENVGIPFGDILLTPDQMQSGYNGINFTKDPEKKWKNGIIPYFISITDYNYNQRMLIENAIADFNSKVESVRIRPRRPFLDKDYIMIFNGNGCFCPLGRQGGQQPLSLQIDGCMKERTVQHEFMHALGLLHEQNRPDRDEYIRLLPENIPEDWRQWYEKMGPPDYVMVGEYDYYSALHYRVEAPETGKPAFIVLKEGINETQIGYGDGVSPQDIEKINIIYGEN